ncbi:MAG TPA: cysteine hydrolase family protein [Ktedonosporobacter sp.]|nr:cysteine hydrolase family protein [Ktedonosporobacter sp.]
MADTALLVIDVQVGMFAEDDPVYQGNQLLATISNLIEKARQAEIPVIYIQHGSKRKGHPVEEGTAGWQLHPAIAPQEGDAVVRKRMPDSFYETSLQEELVARGIKKLVITGIQTDLCVDTTSRRACSLDYDVTLVADGHSTWDREQLSAPQIIAHHNSVLDGWFVTLKKADEISFNEQDASLVESMTEEPS